MDDRFTNKDASERTWRRAGRCGPDGGDCVEVAWDRSGVVGVRDSKPRAEGEELRFPARRWGEFLRALRRR
ncbi:hypothetical protein GCM10010492_59260 [Saccharothrix mutabilis subsp. mutabilis]|uniref:DUF397 domain-containing protein n=1 Tax=Saccharothrix mutabilis subsp. mutabilis TaxID=66855 RepID=A0ABN0UIF2_9PSEU